MSADTIPIRFAYLIAYFVRRNDDGGGHRWTELTPRHRHDRCRERKKERACKEEDRGEVPRKNVAGGRAATTSSFMQLAHRCYTDGRDIISYEPRQLCSCSASVSSDFMALYKCCYYYYYYYYGYG